MNLDQLTGFKIKIISAENPPIPAGIIDNGHQSKLLSSDQHWYERTKRTAFRPDDALLAFRRAIHLGSAAAQDSLD